jgi:hypothetical protein
LHDDRFLSCHGLKTLADCFRDTAPKGVPIRGGF